MSERLAYAARLHQALDRHLTYRERIVLLDMICGMNMTEIARENGVSPARIRQVKGNIHWKADRVFRGLLR